MRFCQILQQVRIALAFGQGDISQDFADKIGRVYQSSAFGTAQGYSGEARFHRRAAAAGLRLKCEVSQCPIPISVWDDGLGDYRVEIRDWPVLLPKNLLRAMVDMGLASMLLGDAAERARYWDEMLPYFPQMRKIDASASVPLAFYGDEGNSFRQSVMAFHFQSLCNPYSTNSILSRYLVAMVPSEYYWVAARSEKNSTKFSYILSWFLTLVKVYVTLEGSFHSRLRVQTERSRPSCPTSGLRSRNLRRQVCG